MKGVSDGDAETRIRLRGFPDNLSVVGEGSEALAGQEKWVGQIGLD
jgi:hypothetical protein